MLSYPIGCCAVASWQEPACSIFIWQKLRLLLSVCARPCMHMQMLCSDRQWEAYLQLPCKRVGEGDAPGC